MYMKKFDYKDINLVPKKCIVDSRSECDTSLKLGNFTFKMPIVPSNMESVINEDLCIKLAEAGYFYIMHRFDNDMFEFHKMMKSKLLISSISMGVNEDAYQLVDKFVDNDTYPDFITIDIAHGHSVKMKDMIKYIKANLPGSFIIAGNVSTPEGVSDLESWGAHATKVGIAPGCFTADAEVMTKNGLKSLSEISLDDYVLTHKNRYKRVLNKHSKTTEFDLLSINGLAPCTKSHEFYVILKSDKDFVNEQNLNDYGFFIEAEKLNKKIHLLVKL